MERAPVRNVAVTPPLGWRIAGRYLPVAALALAAFLVARMVAVGSDAPSAPLATVDPGHAERLAANIAFFESRVMETRDSLSYNRLTGLYLQRLRESGDVTDLGRAEIAATRSLEVNPRDYTGLVNLALVRVAQHEFVAAAELSREAIATVPSRPDAFAVLGDAQMALGDYDGARGSYDTFLERAPGASAFGRRAALAEVDGNVAVAEQFWKAAIDADATVAPESSAWARVQLGNLRVANNRLADARREFDTALRVYPGYTHAEAGLAKVAASSGELAEAAERYERATAIIPSLEYAVALGDVYRAAGRQQDADRQFGLVRAIGQLYAANGIRDELTLILFEADHGGDPAATVAAAREAYSARPSLAAADVLAWSLYRAGQLPEARAMAETALRTGIHEPLYLYHASAIADAQGDERAARAYLARLAALNPAFSPAHAAEVRALMNKLEVAQ